MEVAFSVEDAIARGLWLDDTFCHDIKGKNPVGPFIGRSREVSSISYHKRPFHQLPYRPPTFIAQSPTPHYQLQPAYV